MTSKITKSFLTTPWVGLYCPWHIYITLLVNNKTSSNITNLFNGAGALVTNILLKWTFIIKQTIVYIFEKSIIFGTFLWQSIKKKVRQIKVEFALCRLTTNNTGRRTTKFSIRVYPLPPTSNEQEPTHPVNVNVAVNPVNLVGRRSIGFTIN